MATHDKLRAIRAAFAIACILGCISTGCDGVLGINGLAVGCTENMTQCQGQMRQRCDARGQWIDVAPCVEQACFDGACVGTCAPNSTSCAPVANAMRTCNADGEWNSEQSCVDQTCINGECSGVCAPGSKNCAGNELQGCDAGQWSFLTMCPYACSNAVCVCVPGQKRCDANTLESCVAGGNWQTEQKCTDRACDLISESCIGQCAPGQKRCQGQTPLACNDLGQWVNAPLCDSGLHCEAGECIVDCATGDKRCFDNERQTCNANGVWQADPSGLCVASTCDPNTLDCVGICAPGKQCKDGTTPQQCNALGQWDDLMTCQYACVAGECTECAPNEVRCSANTPQTCVPPGQWQDEPSGACIGQTCLDGVCLGVCGPGDMRCAGNSPQTCDQQGAWVGDVPCSVGSCQGGQCLVNGCSPGDLRCVGDFPEKCDANGEWQSNGPVCGSCVECDVATAVCGALQNNDMCREPTAIAIGSSHVCALLPGKNIKCWGGNAYGQLGLGTASARGDGPGEMGDNLPLVNFGTGATATTLAPGSSHTCALLSGGTVKCWGLNTTGQLGLGDKVWRGDDGGEMGDNLPLVDFGTGATATAISAGIDYTCVLLPAGLVKCWGYNHKGQLGLGDVATRGDNSGEMGDVLPTINLGTGVTAIAVSAGEAHTCVLTSAGRVKCWGWNQSGQLGLGDTIDRGDNALELGDNLPFVDLGTGVTAKAIAAGRWHTCALLSNDALKCWGYNTDGQLGLGDTNTRGDHSSDMGDNLPIIDLGPNKTATAIAAGFFHTCAILSDGQLKCWGANAQGQLGLEDQEDRGDGPNEMGNQLPTVDLGVGAKAAAIATGSIHTCVLLVGGSVKCWGYNADGQLGLGDSSKRGVAPGQMGDHLLPVDL